jgi:hypothetical protein
MLVFIRKLSWTLVLFSMWKAAILRKVKEIKGSLGEALVYVAQVSPKIDVEIAQKGSFRMKTMP